MIDLEIRHAAGVAIMALETLTTVVARWKNGLSAEKTPAQDLAEMLLFLKDLHDALDENRKTVYHAVDALSKGILPEKLDHMGLDLIRVPELGRSFSVRNHNSASILDKPKAFEWLRGIGQGDVIIETVNAQTLATVCKTMLLEQGIEPPEDAIKTSTYKSTSITKYTPKPGAR